MSRFIEELEKRLIDPDKWDRKRSIPSEILAEAELLIEKDFRVAIGKDGVLGHFVLFLKEEKPKEEPINEPLHEGKDTDQEQSLPCKGS